ncbi:hypothetical protein [Patulibacter defluvii]|uniref:hypothetical protein n=1 Tax=Patulibacter defluvii TaxID=3095358 RepID=UPI002A74C0CA|nr:hypothetical protein [Patulibacter sp. DM4]
MDHRTPSRLRRALTCALAATAVATGVSAAPASAAPVKSLEDDAMVLSDDQATRDRFWASAEALGVRQVRILITWDAARTTIDDPSRIRLRRATEEANAHGIRPLIGLFAPFSKAKGVSRSKVLKVIKAYRPYAESLAASVADLQVAGYITWNEPNWPSQWPHKYPQLWAKASNAGYAGYKAGDPDGPVLVGEFSPYASSKSVYDPGDFLRRALCLTSGYQRLAKSRRSKDCQTKVRGDAIGIHPYDFLKKPMAKPKSKDVWTIANLAEAKRAWRKAANRGAVDKKATKDFRITEFAFLTAGKKKISTTRAAKYLASAWKIAKRERVTSFSWYQLQDPVDPKTGWQSGLLNRLGAERKTYKVFAGLK